MCQSGLCFSRVVFCRFCAVDDLQSHPNSRSKEKKNMEYFPHVTSYRHRIFSTTCQSPEMMELLAFLPMAAWGREFATIFPYLIRKNQNKTHKEKKLINSVLDLLMCMQVKSDRSEAYGGAVARLHVSCQCISSGAVRSGEPQIWKVKKLKMINILILFHS